MKRVSDKEISEREENLERYEELKSVVIVTLIPFINFFFYRMKGRRNALVSSNRMKVRWIYFLFQIIPLLLPTSVVVAHIMLSTEYHYEWYFRLPSWIRSDDWITAEFWILYFLTAFVIAKKHIKISKALGEKPFG